MTVDAQTTPLFQRPIHRFAIHDKPFLEPQQHPEPSIPKRGMLLNQLAQTLRPRRVCGTPSCPEPSHPVQASPAYA
jgi:hypothetical protein